MLADVDHDIMIFSRKTWFASAEKIHRDIRQSGGRIRLFSKSPGSEGDCQLQVPSSLLMKKFPPFIVVTTGCTTG